MENIVLENEKEKLKSVIRQYHEVFEDVTLALNSQKKRPMPDLLHFIIF